METAFEAFCASGLWPSLGRTTASRLAGAGIIGPDDVGVERLAAIEGVSDKRAERLAKTWAEAQPAFAVAELIHPSLPVRLARGLVDALGHGAAQALREDPWRVLDLPEVQPRQADAFALAVLSPRPGKGDERRGRAFTQHVLARAARDGHTVQPAPTVTAALAGLDVPDPRAAVEAALADGRVLGFETYDAQGEPRQLLGLERYAMAEDAIAEGIARLQATAPPLSTSEGAVAVTGGLDEAQRQAVQAMAEHGVTLLTGGPGTGKSRTVAAVVELARRRARRIALAAPTGRAAKRLEELTGEEAVTLHRLLGAQGTTGEFSRGEDWPLDAEVVVVDETSMLDVELAAALLDACADGTHLLFVGDPAQLPLIGAGRVLGDLVESGAVPVTELTTLHRTAEGSAIATLAAAVRRGELPRVDSPDHEVVVVPASTSAEAAHRVVQLVTDSIPRATGVAVGDVQVVTPVHRGAAGTIALNTALKQQLNPGPGAVGGFDVGDRVVATANHLDEGFANGEVGVVTAAVDGALTVAFAAARRDGAGEDRLRPPARVGDHGAPGAGLGVAGRRGGHATRGGRDAQPPARLHGADAGAAAPVRRPCRGAGARPGGEGGRGPAAADPAALAARRRRVSAPTHGTAPRRAGVRRTMDGDDRLGVPPAGAAARHRPQDGAAGAHRRRRAGALGARPGAALPGRPAEGGAAPPHPAGPLDAARPPLTSGQGAAEDQIVARNRSSTRTPNRSDSSGTRSSTPWNIPKKSRSSGSRSGENPKHRIPSRANDLASVPPDRQ